MKCPWVDAAMMRGRQSSVSPEHPFRARRVFVETTLFVGFADGEVIKYRRARVPPRPRLRVL